MHINNEKPSWAASIGTMLLGMSLAAGVAGCERKSDNPRPDQDWTPLGYVSKPTEAQLQGLQAPLQSAIDSCKNVLAGVKTDGAAWFEKHPKDLDAARENIAAATGALEHSVSAKQFDSNSWTMQLGATRTALLDAESSLQPRALAILWTEVEPQDQKSGADLLKEALGISRTTLAALEAQKDKSAPKAAAGTQSEDNDGVAYYPLFIPSLFNSPSLTDVSPSRIVVGKSDGSETVAEEDPAEEESLSMTSTNDSEEPEAGSSSSGSSFGGGGDVEEESTGGGGGEEE